MSTINGLTKEETQEYNKYKKMQDFFKKSENEEITNTYDPMKDEVAEFNDNIKDVENLLPEKMAKNEGTTTEKDVRKNTVAEYWFTNVLSKSKAYAFKVKNTELGKKVSLTKSQLLDMRDGDLQPFCKGIQDTLTPFLTNTKYMTYGVTATTLSDGMKVANDFKEYIGKTKEENSRKTVASNSIKLDFDALRANNIQFRLLIAHFKESNPDYYNGFAAVDVEDDIGVRHTGIDGKVVNKLDGSALHGAVILNVTQNKKTKTDLLGEYELIKQKPGDCEIEVTFAGKKKITKIVKMKRGKIIDMDFEMEDE